MFALFAILNILAILGIGIAFAVQYFSDKDKYNSFRKKSKNIYLYLYGALSLFSVISAGLVFYFDEKVTYGKGSSGEKKSYTVGQFLSLFTSVLWAMFGLIYFLVYKDHKVSK